MLITRHNIDNIYFLHNYEATILIACLASVNELVQWTSVVLPTVIVMTPLVECQILNIGTPQHVGVYLIDLANTNGLRWADQFSHESCESGCLSGMVKSTGSISDPDCQVHHGPITRSKYQQKTYPTCQKG